MGSAVYRFDDFTLDEGERRLRRGDTPVELNNRYFDALALLVREDGRLVSKDRFLDEVWNGVPVTDEALTQCVRMLRRQLGDDAARPRFIETVPKHGYRFIARVETSARRPVPLSDAGPLPRLPVLAAAGIVGGGIAGLFGGLFYGFAASGAPLGPGTGATSVLLVLLAITSLVAVLGAAGVSLGIAAAGTLSRPFDRWTIAGGAAGGLIVGAVVKLVGRDAFELLFGRSPGDFTGAAEGLVLGAAVGIGTWLAMREETPVRRAILMAGALGAAAGLSIALLGGRMMGGSLAQLARSFPDSRLRLDQIGALFGEADFGPVSQAVLAGLEGALFAGCVVGAMAVAEHKLHAHWASRVDRQPHPLPAEG
ncbi:transcriptional regulator [Sphingomonas sabuli]|uniref:Transcriptional regulator n=1 Tax=Sphingomonas sabuli TaxID=2764186 RepID=A0A7G9L683_9SPHN|nr:transcriptional regulator [Sphingomonas sabuli]QNM84132.1 transcriptional regulator [Sphingomonas sabuli]